MHNHPVVLSREQFIQPLRFVSGSPRGSDPLRPASRHELIVARVQFRGKRLHRCRQLTVQGTSSSLLLKGLLIRRARIRGKSHLLQVRFSDVLSLRQHVLIAQVDLPVLLILFRFLLNRFFLNNHHHFLCLFSRLLFHRYIWSGMLRVEIPALRKIRLHNHYRLLLDQSPAHRVPSLLRHCRVPSFGLLHLARCESNVLLHFPRQVRDAHPVVGEHAFLQGGVVHLLVLREVFPGFRVHIMCQHVLPVDVAAHSRIGVAFAVQVEGGFPEIGGKCRVRQPPRGRIQVRYPLIHVLFLLLFRRHRPFRPFVLLFSPFLLILYPHLSLLLLLLLLFRLLKVDAAYLLHGHHVVLRHSLLFPLVLVLAGRLHEAPVLVPLFRLPLARTARLHTVPLHHLRVVPLEHVPHCFRFHLLEHPLLPPVVRLELRLLHRQQIELHH